MTHALLPLLSPVRRGGVRLARVRALSWARARLPYLSMVLISNDRTSRRSPPPPIAVGRSSPHLVVSSPRSFPSAGQRLTRSGALPAPQRALAAAFLENLFLENLFLEHLFSDHGF